MLSFLIKYIKSQKRKRKIQASLSDKQPIKMSSLGDRIREVSVSYNVGRDTSLEYKVGI